MTPTRVAEIGLGRVAGIDEVGVGCLAGPVVAAAVILPGDPRLPSHPAFGDFRDSKTLQASVRERLHGIILSMCECAVGEASPDEIDRHGLQTAIFLAMRRAVDGLPSVPEHLLIDGNKKPKQMPCPITMIVKGDMKATAIAAASILAKHHRDTLMAGHAKTYPGYGWERNAGYPTSEHRTAISDLGLTPLHRRSFMREETTPDLFSV